MKPTGQEMPVIEKIVCYSVEEERAHHTRQVQVGKHQVVKSQREKNGQQPLLWFPWEGTAEAG